MEKKKSQLKHKNDPKTKTKSKSKSKSKTKFDEFLEMDMGRGGVYTAEEDLELERRLAKKLKVKKGKLTGPDDGINSLFEGLFSDLDADDDMNYESDEALLMGADVGPAKKNKQKRKHSKLQSEEESTPEDGASEVHKKRKKKRKDSKPQIEEGNDAEKASDSEPGKKKGEKRKKVVENETTECEKTEEGIEKSEDKPVVISSVAVKYVPPHLRATANAEAEEIAQTRRRLRGLLNRMSESNVESITEEIAAIFRLVWSLIGIRMSTAQVYSATYL